MLIKQLEFEPTIIDILRAIRWADDGLSAVIDQQLSRDDYIKVNKALEALGGVWSRREKAHLFTIDPRCWFAELLESGKLIKERDGFFETPAAVVDFMFDVAEPDGLCLEPSAGLGAIAKRLVERVGKDKIFCIEKNAKRATILEREGYNVLCWDFLTYEGAWSQGNDCKKELFDRVYMNPPFELGQDIEHVRHAYKFLVPGGILVAIMSEGSFIRMDSKATSFREWLKTLSYGDYQLPEGAFKSSGTMVRTRLVMVEK
jgi:16S rRNA G966 N2-methylase RsmD